MTDAVPAADPTENLDRAAGSAAGTAELTIERPAHGGHFVARHEGRVVFVRHALPGEVVRVRFTDTDEAASFWRADVVEVIEPSPHRVTHPWPLADALTAAAKGRSAVGGAEFGHIALDEQRRLKGAIVEEQLARLAKTDRAVTVEAAPGEAPDGLAWRTRAAFAVDSAGRLAMHLHRSHGVVPVREMPLAVAAVNDLRLWALDLSGIERVDVAVPSGGGEPLVLLVPAAGTSPRRVASVASSVHGASVGVLDPASGQVERLKGRTWLQESVLGIDYRVTGAGFWQIHRGAPEALVSAVLDGLRPAPGERIADLYAGAGLFTVPLARAVGPEGSVLSVEGAPGTSRDARRNLHGQDHVSIVQGRVDAVLGRWSEPLDAVLLDPPRAGAGRKVVRQIVQARPRVVGYVSCDPASFARDLGYFLAAGWSLDSLRVFDLYPHTHHMESFARLLPPPA
ncbi:class I SAM-dependent RNA methyltransferase [Arthrobacter agilis]|uniref:Class I SAM-dependent RNA methyltransferase n=1 Tax=Arthrobacter agilis TaxID=37921 RepID=A0A2L0UCW1_9MICC|nr:TRAM domain-containing protein [Arthrobacter agilis]AUZ87057.1 class I SAM-dependent RNA methyltransferase [Arthrobacter agilis]